MNILIVSSSIRENASTKRVAMHLVNEIRKSHPYNVELVDLTAYEYPLWKEVFHREVKPPEECKVLHDKLEAADAMIFVTPEYNGSYSLALKNMVDYFGLKVFERKIIGVSAVSIGNMGGIRAALQLQQLILAVYAIAVPQMLLVPNVHLRFDADGNLTDDLFAKNVQLFNDYFLWLCEAVHAKRTQRDSVIP